MLRPYSRGILNLLQLEQILTEAHARYANSSANSSAGYDQSRFFRDRCGTPACALGHWIAANSDQVPFTWADAVIDHGASIYPKDFRKWLLNQFEITAKEAAELFSSAGCGYAKTAAEAAAYIRDFVERKIATDPALANVSQ